MTQQNQDPPYNAADPQQVKGRKQTEKQVREQELSDLTAVMAMPEGRRVIKKLLNDCGMFRTSYHPSSQIYFNEGQRNVGLRIWADLEAACPQLLWQMIVDHHGKLG